MARDPSRGSRGTVAIVFPPLPGLQNGNRTTAERWAELLETLGWNVFCDQTWDGRECDVLVALHARHSHGTVLRFHRERPNTPIVVVGTGTDLYSDIEDSGAVRESLGLAHRIVVLQPLAIRALPEELRERARVIHQSARPLSTPVEKSSEFFEVAFPANVRPVKDPLCALRAAQRLPRDTRIRIVHLGGAVDTGLNEELLELARETPAFLDIGPVPREEALRTIARSRLVLSTSRHEGGGNTISEAFALDVPVLATRIPGSMGLLGEGYPGLFGVSDDEALAELLQRAQGDTTFYGELQAACRERAWIADPRTELESWRRLLDELET